MDGGVREGSQEEANLPLNARPLHRVSEAILLI